MSVQLEGLDSLVQKLKSLEDVHRVMYPVLVDGGAKLVEELAQYPKKAPGAFSQWATPGQRRAYWAKVRKDPSMHGANGYRRTGTSGRKWTSIAIRTTNGVRLVVGNNAGYAQYIWGRDTQQKFHEVTGFTTDEKALNKVAPQIMSNAQRAIHRELNK